MWQGGQRMQGEESIYVGEKEATEMRNRLSIRGLVK